MADGRPAGVGLSATETAAGSAMPNFLQAGTRFSASGMPDGMKAASCSTNHELSPLGAVGYLDLGMQDVLHSQASGTNGSEMTSMTTPHSKGSSDNDLSSSSTTTPPSTLDQETARFEGKHFLFKKKERKKLLPHSVSTV
jgi:hypothetical protein